MTLPPGRAARRVGARALGVAAGLLAWALLGLGPAAAQPPPPESPAPPPAPASAPATAPAPTLAPAPASTPAMAPAGTPATAPTSAPAPSQWGLTLDLGWASAFVFRGANILAGDSHRGQHGMINPSVTWTIGETGWSLGYWGAYQINGGNVGSNLDAGLGAEQDLIVSYSRALTARLKVTGTLTYYFNLGADRAAAGTSVPSFLEPLVGATYSRGADFGLKVAYYAGVQQALELDRYLYLNPTVERSFTLREEVQLSLLAGFGYKLYNDRAAHPENVYDVLITMALPVTIRERFYLRPSVSVAWTNLEGKGFGDEWVLFGGVNVGANL